MSFPNRLRLAVGGLWLAGAALAGEANLLTNGDFAAAGDPLRGWTPRNPEERDTRGEWWGHDALAVESTVAGRDSVLRIRSPGGASAFLIVSDLVPFTPGAAYRLRAWGRTTGPDVQVRVEAYAWRRGVQPHAQPKPEELRRCFRGPVLRFGDPRATGDASGAVDSRWREASGAFPQEPLSAEARRLFEQVAFLAVSITSWYGPAGDLFIDDVRLERVAAAGRGGTK